MPFAWLAFIVSLATTNPASGSDALRSMVEAERAFSRMSVERGMRDAFVTNLADDAIVFNPPAGSPKDPGHHARVTSATPTGSASE